MREIKILWRRWRQRVRERRRDRALAALIKYGAENIDAVDYITVVFQHQAVPVNGMRALWDNHHRGTDLTNGVLQTVQEVYRKDGDADVHGYQWEDGRWKDSWGP